MHNKEVIVTGATGFVGQYVIPILLERNFNVIAIARDKKKARNFDWLSSVSFFSIDIHKDSYQLDVKENTGLIHLAWQGLPNYKSLFHFEENYPKNYLFIKDLIYRGVKNILVSGTCLEYGLQCGELDVSTISQPNNSYAFSKDCLRKSLFYLKSDIPFYLKWARIFYVYGEGQAETSLISSLDYAIDRGDEFFKMSGGEQLRDYLHISLAAKKLVDIFDSEKEGIFNVCSGTAVSVRRMVEERIKERNSNIQLKLGAFPYADYEPMAFWGKSFNPVK